MTPWMQQAAGRIFWVALVMVALAPFVFGTPGLSPVGAAYSQDDGGDDDGDDDGNDGDDDDVGASSGGRSDDRAEGSPGVRQVPSQRRNRAGQSAPPRPLPKGRLW